jgi:serine/threonine protein kinase
MSNDTPPRACLTDIGLMTMVFDPHQPMACSVQIEGGTMRFMSPELLVPSKFGMKDLVPTPEADIYAFGLVIFQVCKQGRIYRLFSHFVQVLTGEIPFRGVRQTELGYAVAMGKRPDKPANAAAIGFSNSLWDFVQRCWDGDMSMRPKVAEVVAYLEEAAAKWDGLSKEPISDSMEPSEFEVSTPL